eukprot:CAMPEP_0197705030 /NCGR_PEP_ID=MMETSP1338-20131121/126236_1 /TAXON_ID=43686 ORGANISM="Pelagodinium beii, Strain RCC1491" /NCGR_SAMPLE_ID=MMETSP1338 /ASSEMBLY_ACC=CAM_ASM_000754 /LENGTH=644 /DNA_ID=CAMNT_0043288935 /DNA_START=98 /DNA_END=2032 /DNA_ORIENTATION=+
MPQVLLLALLPLLSCAIINVRTDEQAKPAKSLLRAENANRASKSNSSVGVEADANGCLYQSWSGWSKCRSDCIGTQERDRKTAGVDQSCSTIHEKRDCAKHCPFCSWSSWGEWESCDVVEFQTSTRKRFMYFPKGPSSVQCLVDEEVGSVETERKNCICLYSNWTKWEPCGQKTSCESKVVSRQRTLREDSLKDPDLCKATIVQKKLCWEDTCFQAKAPKPCTTTPAPCAETVTVTVPDETTTTDFTLTLQNQPCTTTEEPTTTTENVEVVYISSAEPCTTEEPTTTTEAEVPVDINVTEPCNTTEEAEQASKQVTTEEAEEEEISISSTEPCVTTTDLSFDMGTAAPCSSDPHMVPDPAAKNTRCGPEFDPSRVFELLGADATEEKCSAKCSESDSCVAYSAEFGRWCIGCDEALGEFTRGATAYKKEQPPVAGPCKKNESAERSTTEAPSEEDNDDAEHDAEPVMVEQDENAPWLVKGKVLNGKKAKPGTHFETKVVVKPCPKSPTTPTTTPCPTTTETTTTTATTTTTTTTTTVTTTDPGYDEPPEPAPTTPKPRPPPRIARAPPAPPEEQEPPPPVIPCLKGKPDKPKPPAPAKKKEERKIHKTVAPCPKAATTVATTTPSSDDSTVFEIESDMEEGQSE